VCLATPQQEAGWPCQQHHSALPLLLLQPLAQLRLAGARRLLLLSVRLVLLLCCAAAWQARLA
jgi:hypothetical protein